MTDIRKTRTNDTYSKYIPETIELIIRGHPPISLQMTIELILQYYEVLYAFNRYNNKRIVIHDDESAENTSKRLKNKLRYSK